jgi:glycosyltransferase involved in cell wall biosynthesis
MKILCFIDNLGSGGAQRQLTTLGVGLKKRGHEVRFLVYHPEDHFLPVLERADIRCEVIAPCSQAARLLAVRRMLRQGWQDVVLAFLEGPCWYAELAWIPGRSWGVVAGERLADPRIRHGVGHWLRHFHRLADAVVCNSHTNRLMLEAGFPFLNNKLATVYNTVDLELFHPPDANDPTWGFPDPAPLRIVVAASYQEKKNMLGVAKALLHLKRTAPHQAIVVDWYGATPADAKALRETQRFIADHGLSETMRLNAPTKSIEREYTSAAAVGLFSYFEGLPNVVCEAMTCGKPVILSNVCDAGNLVQDGVNGFLCDPASPESIAEAICRFAEMSAADKGRLGVESRRMAESLFAGHHGLDRYERILTAAARHQPIPKDSSWPAAVPESAVRSSGQPPQGTR